MILKAYKGSNNETKGLKDSKVDRDSWGNG